LIFLLALVFAVIMFGNWLLEHETERLEQKIQRLEEEIEAQELQLNVTRKLIEEVQQLRSENEDLHQQMQDWLDTWQVDTWEATMYAPLDPAAVPGMCFEGDPNETYSGQPPVPGKTAAAHVSFLGEEVFVLDRENGLSGWRKVNDIGGDVGQGRIDLVVNSRSEALRFGREDITVVHRRGE